MALPAPLPARLFAELVPAQTQTQTPTPTAAPSGRGVPPAPPGREMHVSGSAELSARPDRARVSLRLGSRKEEAGAARSSVARRLEYIAQTARQRGVPVCIIFSDFGKMQNICNLLIEKLGTSITISPPHFYHTPGAIDTLRRQVCVAAVGNTRQKAQEVCRLFGQTLGKPLLIREEETKEWGGHIDSPVSNSPDSLTLQERIQNATAYASCRVFAVFEIKGKEKRRSKLL
ncbi:interleukin-1 receptor-associated kinase 1-binding protein 1 isoform X2 [Heliangelus exortis]|uniref:interleukin-1 receptor-associated kinase 1-binding protein 1 isoform X2 n=1 Tax=Heliangelus exortis TaxID=472823 RepID=UPI003A95783B